MEVVLLQILTKTLEYNSKKEDILEKAHFKYSWKSAIKINMKWISNFYKDFCLFSLWLELGVTSSFYYQKYCIKYLRDVLIVVSPRFIDIFAFCPWTASESLLLLVASQNQIVADNITSQVHNIYSVVRNGSHIVALDFDSISGRVFWSDGSQGKIWSAFQNGTDRRVVSTFLLIFGLTSLPVLRLLLLLTSESRSYLILGSSRIPLWAMLHPGGLDIHNSQYMGVLDKNVASEGSTILNSWSHDTRLHNFFFYSRWEHRKMQWS